MVVKDPLARNLDVAAKAIVCRPASSWDELAAAFELLYRRYLSAGLVAANPSRMRVAKHQLRSECIVVVAVQGQSVVGTVSLTEDGPMRLSLDECFGQALDGLRRDKLKLVEASCLAVERNSGDSHTAIVGALIRAAFHFARARSADRLIAAVHPRHSRFYERAMGFQRISQEIPFDSAEGNLAVCVSGQAKQPESFHQPWRSLCFGPIDPSLQPASRRDGTGRQLAGNPRDRAQVCNPEEQRKAA